MREIVAEIEARGWGWSVGRSAGCTADGFVHLPDGECVMAEADTPEAALRDAFTEASATVH